MRIVKRRVRPWGAEGEKRTPPPALRSAMAGLIVRAIDESDTEMQLRAPESIECVLGASSRNLETRIDEMALAESLGQYPEMRRNFYYTGGEEEYNVETQGEMRGSRGRSFGLLLQSSRNRFEDAVVYLELSYRSEQHLVSGISYNGMGRMLSLSGRGTDTEHLEQLVGLLELLAAGERSRFHGYLSSMPRTGAGGARGLLL